MDPFSITAGTIGITGVALTSFEQLHNLLSAFAEANEEVRDINACIEGLNAPLSAIEELVNSRQDISVAAETDFQKADVADAVNQCGRACAQYAEAVKRWTRRSIAGRLSFRDRFLVGVWNKEKTRTMRTQLQSCVDTLQLAVSSAQL